MPNSLTAHASLKLGPVVLETFFKHYLERKSETHDREGSSRSTNLRHDELMWQEAFELVKHFLNQATKFTVEELQEFSNSRIPTPPWIWVSRVVVPMSSCDRAATHLIKALGGEDVAKRVVGGTKWWQVRGVRGIDCQWICQKSHIYDSRKRKSRFANSSDSQKSSSRPSFRSFFSSSHSRSNLHSSFAEDKSQVQENREEKHDARSRKDRELDISDMDGTRCLLYAHGGGYYFGSVDQERYTMQRYARKIRGRVFACNYRLSPQYPFPCAIQDLLAAYIYLIDPPPDAVHAPVPPGSLMLGGDSAGGGLCLAVLQVIRDCGLPLPAGAVLISPWCDLTHSFPSITQNTATDIIPPYGLSLHKPSVLWPPPPDEIAVKVRAGLRARFQKVARRAAMVEAFFPSDGRNKSPSTGSNPRKNDRNYPEDIEGLNSKSNPDNDNFMRNDASSSHGEKNAEKSPEMTDEPKGSPVVGKSPLPWESSDSIHLHVDGHGIAIHNQVQFYCPNSLLAHPLVSPALGYLGGLPPLLVIASDKEVLRDEIVYIAHKAAHPDRFPASDDAELLYPPLRGRDKVSPTSVHLQIYDETAHVLPLFSFITPAKYCYRAIASFINHLTPSGPLDPLDPLSHQAVILESDPSLLTSPEDKYPVINPSTSFSQGSDSPPGTKDISDTQSHSIFTTKRKIVPTKSRTISEGLPIIPDSPVYSGDVYSSNSYGPGTAGDPSIYLDKERSKDLPLGNIMIRERVSTNGAVRPLEAESELGAFQLQPSHIGKFNEAVARRYLEGKAIWAKKFSKTTAKIEMQRRKNLELSKKETGRIVKTMAQFQEHLLPKEDIPETARRSFKAPWQSREDSSTSNDIERYTWGWAWALDGEHPPPSSIVSRRDTAEARNLARVADISVEQAESKLSGNRLWNVLVNFLTDASSRGGMDRDADADDREASETQMKSGGEDRKVSTLDG